MAINNDNVIASEFQNNRPKRKRKKGWIVFLVIFLIIFVLPVSTFFGLFFDPTRNAIHVDPDLEINEMFNTVLVDSLDNTTDAGDERLELVLTQDDLNQLLYIVTSSAPAEVTKFVPQLDVKIKGEHYDFYINIDLSFFKTKIILKTIISEDDVNQAFVFTIEDIAICRLQGLASLTSSILSQYITDDSIEELFNDYLHMEVDLKNRKITYPESNLLQDIKSLTNSTGSEAAKLYFSIVAELLDQGILDFDFDGRIQTKLALPQLMTNEYIDGGYNLNLTSVLDAAAADTKTKIEGGTIASTDSAAIKDNFSAYFDANANIPASDDPGVIMTSHIPPISSYTVGEITDFKNSSDPTLSYITEAELNGYIADIALIGTTYIVSAYYDDVATVQYITTDNFYCNFISNADGDFIYFGIGLNINGCQTNVVFVTEYDSTAPTPSSSIAMKFITRQIYYGEVLLFDSEQTNISEGKGSLVSALFNMVASALVNVETMTINEDDYSINIEFAFDTVVQNAIDLLNAAAPFGSAKADFYADDELNSNVGKLKVVWQND